MGKRPLWDIVVRYRTVYLRIVMFAMPLYRYAPKLLIRLYTGVLICVQLQHFQAFCVQRPAHLITPHHSNLHE